ncbi:30S ribosomal protein S7 [Rickettsiales bacterium]|nr:30S ribosomal protein S7 [Rickettsiales bacterium]MDB2550553.1 30S ribosomal protein S7 [Rickettsiales bacterium]
MRRRAAKIKPVFPDAKYNEVVITRFINRLMIGGKKSTVTKSLYKSFELINKRLNRDPLEVFKAALDNVTPRIEVRSKRIGGATYQIPSEVNPRRATALALKWFSMSVAKSNAKDLVSKLAEVIIDSMNNKGWAVKKREEVFKMAEANKAFAHYR